MLYESAEKKRETVLLVKTGTENIKYEKVSKRKKRPNVCTIVQRCTSFSTYHCTANHCIPVLATTQNDNDTT